MVVTKKVIYPKKSKTVVVTKKVVYPKKTTQKKVKPKKITPRKRLKKLVAKDGLLRDVIKRQKKLQETMDLMFPDEKPKKRKATKKQNSIITDSEWE